MGLFREGERNATGGENCREEREITVIVSEKLQGNIIL